MKRKMKKKYLVLISAVSLMIFTAFTLAFFTNSDFLTNRFSGENKAAADPTPEISVAEIFEPPEEKSDAPFQKTVQIANTGNADCYIRVRLEFSSSAIRDISWISNDDDPDNESAYVNAAEFPFSALPEGWEYRAGDGFFYYTAAVPPGESTAVLMNWVKTLFPADGSVDADEYDIFVYSEAVNADNESGERMSYEEAWR